VPDTDVTFEAMDVHAVNDFVARQVESRSAPVVSVGSENVDFVASVGQPFRDVLADDFNAANDGCIIRY
jgi:hypothetical protein